MKKKQKRQKKPEITEQKSISKSSSLKSILIAETGMPLNNQQIKDSLESAISKVNAELVARAAPYKYLHDMPEDLKAEILEAGAYMERRYSAVVLNEIWKVWPEGPLLLQVCELLKCEQRLKTVQGQNKTLSKEALQETARLHQTVMQMPNAQHIWMAGGKLFSYIDLADESQADILTQMQGILGQAMDQKSNAFLLLMTMDQPRCGTVCGWTVEDGITKSMEGQDLQVLFADFKSALGMPPGVDTVVFAESSQP